MPYTTTNYDELYANIGNARKAALDSALLNQQQQLAGQQNALAGQYNDVRNQAYTNARVSALGNNERLASLGLAGSANAGPQSGYSESSRVAQDTALGNALNAATRQQQSASDALAMQGNTAMLNRDQQLASTMADLEGQKAAANAQQNQFAANFGLQENQFAEQQRLNAQNQANWQSQFDYGKNQDTLQQQNWQTQFDNANTQWNKQYDFNAAQAAQQQNNWQSQFDYGRSRDTLNDQRYTDETNYSRGRDTLNDQRYTDETNYSHGQADINSAWARANSLGYVDKAASKILGLPVGTKIRR